MKKTSIDYSRTLKVITDCCDLGILQLQVKADNYDGRLVRVDGVDRIHFGNCCYTGLDTNEKIKLGGIDAINRYGNYFSSSRQYLGLALNEELESLLDQITGYHTLVTPTTSLASLSAIPVLITPKDLILMDHQVHASVQNAAKIAEAQGSMVAMVRHNNMIALEEAIIKNKDKYEKIWYLSDGIYSMLGDGCPIDNMYELMDRYPNFYCFVDDAHGMSWIGERGKGYSLHVRPKLHPQMILEMSMNKAFGVCGGILVFPTAESRQYVKCLGAALIFSGPMSTAVLGACIASAKIHLTNEINNIQKDLHNRIKYFREQAYAYNLPLVNHTFSPIFYFGAGSEQNAYQLVKNMLDAGFYTSICNYPVVPNKFAGVRMNITNHLTYEDLEKALATMAGFIEALENENKFNKEKIFLDFKALEVINKSDIVTHESA